MTKSVFRVRVEHRVSGRQYLQHWAGFDRDSVWRDVQSDLHMVCDEETFLIVSVEPVLA